MTSAVDRPGQVPLRDVAEVWPVVSSTEQARGPIVTLRNDLVRMPDGDVVPRQVVQHPGAVAVAALDEAGQVLMIRQYRHPVGRMLWELPAGLRDVAGEPLLQAARRELLEETGYRARDWHVLTDHYSSPGIITERLRVFLARGLAEVPAADRTFVPENEEARQLLDDYKQRGTQVFFAFPWAHLIGPFPEKRRPRQAETPITLPGPTSGLVPGPSLMPIQ